jgi:hypothetical protein
MRSPLSNFWRTGLPDRRGQVRSYRNMVPITIVPSRPCLILLFKTNREENFYATGYQAIFEISRSREKRQGEILWGHPLEGRSRGNDNPRKK